MTASIRSLKRMSEADRYREFMRRTDESAGVSKALRRSAESIRINGTGIHALGSINAGEMLLNSLMVDRSNAKWAVKAAILFPSVACGESACARAEKLMGKSHDVGSRKFRIIHPITARRLSKVYGMHAQHMEYIREKLESDDQRRIMDATIASLKGKAAVLRSLKRRYAD